MVSLTLFVNKTKPGRAMLAGSEDKGAAQLMGVNVNATISLTFAIGSGLAAVAGAVSYTHLYIIILQYKYKFNLRFFVGNTQIPLVRL